MATKTRRTRRPATSRRSLADQLRDLITTSGLTDYALAKASGVDPSSINRFVAGERDWNLGTAELVAAALGVNLSRATRVTRARKMEVPLPTPEADIADVDGFIRRDMESILNRKE